MSGLSKNYGKSTLIPLNYDKEWTSKMSRILGCIVTNLLIKYLQIPLGATLKRVETWRPILQKIEKKLSMWKAKFLSKAGRLVLAKLVLNSLPLCYLDLFKMLKVVAKKIISLYNADFSGETLTEVTECLWLSVV